MILNACPSPGNYTWLASTPISWIKILRDFHAAPLNPEASSCCSRLFQSVRNHVILGARALVMVVVESLRSMVLHVYNISQLDVKL